MPLLLALLLLVATPAIAQNTIPTLLLPEQPVAEPTVGPIGGGDPVAIATDGTNFLIVSSHVMEFLPLGQYAMLVDGDGRPLWKKSVRISNVGWNASATWNGSEFLIASGLTDGPLNFVRLDGSGSVLDPKPIEIEVPPNLRPNPPFPTALWDGSQFVVVTATGYPQTITATRISESGQVLQTNVPVATQASFRVAAGAANGVTVIVWTDTAGSAHVRTMNSAGVVAPVTDLPRIGAITAGADGFVVITVLAGHVWLQRLSPAGQPDAAPVELPITTTAPVRLLSAGSSYLLIYGDQMVHINGGGDFLDSPRTIPSGIDAYSIYGANSKSAIAAWSVVTLPWLIPDATFARRLVSDEPGVQVHRFYNAQQTPRVVWHGNQAVVSWTEAAVREQVIGASAATQVSQDGDIEVAVASGPAATLHVTARGSPWTLHASIGGHEAVLLDPAMINLREVRAVWTGRDFIVVWKRADTTDLVGARLDVNGQITNGPTVIADAQSLTDMAIGVSKAEVLVVWQDRGVAHGVLLTDSGEIPTDAITIPEDLQNNAASFSVASDGQNFLITWIDAQDWIGGRIFDANGHGLTALTDFSPGGDRKDMQTTFWTGSEYLVVWSGSSGVSALRVTRDGRLIDYPPVHIGAIDGFVTSIARGPSGQVVIAYTRADRVYTRFIVPVRQRSAVHR